MAPRLGLYTFGTRAGRKQLNVSDGFGLLAGRRRRVGALFLFGYAKHGLRTDSSGVY